MSTTTMTRESHNLEWENTGPITHLAIDVPADGGVVVLKGANGSGKSHALEATKALLTGEDKIPVRDGQRAATVRGFGATLRVTSRRARSGELEVVSLAGDVQLGKFVDPGVKDPESADATRIRELIKITGVDAHPDEFNGLEGIQILVPSEESDPIKLAALAKKAYQKEARDQENHASLLQGRIDGLKEAAQQVEHEGTTDEAELAAELQAANRRLIELENTRDQQTQIFARAESARQRQAEIASGHQEALDAAIAKYNEISDIVLRRRNDVQELERKLTQAKTLLAEAESAEKLAKAVVDERQKVGETLSLAKAEIERASAIESPVTTEQITAARDEWNARARRMQSAALARKAAEAAREIESLKLAKEERLQMSKAARVAADQVDAVLSRLIDSSGCGLTVDGGRLFIRTDRGMELFDDLSEGERWKIAIDLGVRSVGATGVVVIEQPAWEGIDPTNRHRIASHARARSVVVLTAEADDGPLRAEIVA